VRGSSSEHPRATGLAGHTSPRPAAAWAAWCTCSLIWGSTFLFIRLGNDALAPVWAASLRLALAAALLSLIARLLGHAFPHGRALRAALAYGFLQFGVNFPLLYWGETSFPSGLTAVLYATIPLSTALMTRALGMERLTPLRLAGTGVALGGVALLFSDQLGGQVGLGPALTLLTAATAAACSGVILKRGPRQSPLWCNAVGALVGLPVCLVVSFAIGEAHPFPLRFAAWFPVLYLTFAGSIGAFVLFAWLINHWPVTRVSFIGVVNPVVALVLGWLVRHEHLTLASLAGSLLVLLGVVLGLSGRPAAPAHLSAPRDTGS
jgi:drug/metabolite transporter (DMT)-like permease